MTEPINISGQRENELIIQIHTVRAQRAVIIEFLGLAQKLADSCDKTERLAQMDLEAVYAERSRLTAEETSKQKAHEKTKKKTKKKTTKKKTRGEGK